MGIAGFRTALQIAPIEPSREFFSRRKNQSAAHILRMTARHFRTGGEISARVIVERVKTNLG